MRYNVPQDNRRACLCRDGSYSTKCCDPDDYFSQGIGSIYAHDPEPFTGYRIRRCSDLHESNVHYHGTLTVGDVYYIVLQNGHEACYTVIEQHAAEGIHIASVTHYNDCDACIAAN